MRCLTKAKVRERLGEIMAEVQCDSAIVLLAFDFQVRGDAVTEEGPLHGLETLASVGVWPVTVRFFYEEQICELVMGKEEQAFGLTFPTPFTDEEWRSKPLSASDFWDKESAALEQLVQNGHRHIRDTDEYRAVMFNQAQKMIDWMDTFMQETLQRTKTSQVSLVGVTNTSVSDWSRLTSLLCHGGLWGFPCDQQNHFRQFNYNLLRRTGALAGLPGSAQLSKAIRAFPVKPNQNKAISNAQAQAYEALVTLTWVPMCDDTFWLQPSDNGAFLIFGEAVDRIHRFLQHL